MEDILRELQAYQLDALRKGISYELDLLINYDKTQDIVVKIYYTATGDFLDNRNFRTTFSDDEALTKIKMERIRKFIKDINE